MFADSYATQVCPSGAAQGLEGASRPHFFTGVATVVYQLFAQTDADKAVFGEKDFQQLRVIQHMVRDLHMKTEVIAAPTLREPDGLAMSSRNNYLDAAQRAKAPALYQALQQAADNLRAGDAAEPVLEAAKGMLIAAGFDSVDYFELCTADTLTPVTQFSNSTNKGTYESVDRTADRGASDSGVVLLAAAFIGDVRLIDNLRVFK